MDIKELFIASNRELLRVIEQIKPEQWNLQMPAVSSYSSATLAEAVRYHTYDDAWVPDTLAGKTIDEVGDAYYALRSPDAGDIIANYRDYNLRASAAVRAFEDLERTVHLSYGDFPAREYLQHVTSFRAFRSYDIAKLTDIDTTMDPAFVQALLDEFSPVIEGYRQMGVFPAALPVAEDADPQTRLLAMVGRD